MPANPVRLLLAAFCAVTLAACDGGGSGDFDPLATSQAAAEVVNAMQQSPAFHALDVLGEKIVDATSPGMVAAALPQNLLPRTPFTAWTRDRAADLEALAPRAVAAPIFPADLLGKTLSYNVGLGRYEVSTETGAPANGVRFILYAVDTLLHIVRQPLTAVGRLDLTDESTPAAAVLRLVVVINNATLLDYAASASFTTGSISFGAEGFISNGATSIDFDLTQSITAGPTISVSYTLAVPELDVALAITATLVPNGSTVTLTIEADGNTTVVTATGTKEAITGTVTHNGDVVIEISGTPDEPVFRDANGNELTEAQVGALEELFAFTDAVFDAFDNLLVPAYHLLSFPSGT
ncbi:MAG: hypothetical protein HY337_03670 [Gemmatimonadetes bacterium]|nr:hypothetical protein [Gemmatimonadota bacterium]